MADSVTMHVDGLKELEKKLRELGPDIARNALRAGVRAGANLIKDDAVRNAPEDTGTLKKATYIKHIRERSNNYQQTFFVGVRHGKKYAKRGQDAYYWRFVEFGTAKMSAKPFLRPAFERKKEAAVGAIAARIKIRIDAAGKK
jgi:HK97 gp10 family phage protein